MADHRHLPADRPPGRQSRRRESERRVEAYVLCGLALFFIAIAIWAWTESGPLILAIGLFLGAFGVAAALKGRRRAPKGITLSVWPDELRRGGTLSGRVEGDVAEVGLVCSELYDRTERVYRVEPAGSSTIRSTETAEAHAEWQPTSGQDFAFVVPADAPYSYEGDCVSYAWRVCARGDGGEHETAVWVLP